MLRLAGGPSCGGIVSEFSTRVDGFTGATGAARDPAGRLLLYGARGGLQTVYVRDAAALRAS